MVLSQTSKGTLEAPKGAVPFGIRLARTLLRMLDDSVLLHYFPTAPLPVWFNHRNFKCLSYKHKIFDENHPNSLTYKYCMLNTNSDSDASSYPHTHPCECSFDRQFQPSWLKQHTWINMLTFIMWSTMGLSTSI